ncbi:MAG: lytic transglycosylase domain-containing protein [Nanoarchaeota archaeon]|nr:lytic transglycosylase domain-containing protein [Nanoarchaeota archaeon]
MAKKSYVSGLPVVLGMALPMFLTAPSAEDASMIHVLADLPRFNPHGIEKVLPVPSYAIPKARMARTGFAVNFDAKTPEQYFSELHEKIDEYDRIASHNPLFSEVYSFWKDFNMRWSPEEVYSLIMVESSGNPRATSPMRACGLGQFQESSWNIVCPYIPFKHFVFNPRLNIINTFILLNYIYGEASKIYPNWNDLSESARHDVVFRSYNGGLGNYQNVNWTISKLPLETRDYVPKIKEMIEKSFPSDNFLSNRLSKV